MTRTVTILLLVLALIFVGCESSSKTRDVADGPPDSELSQKEQLIRQIDHRYENPEAHYQLGKLFYAEGKLDKADFEYRVALGFNPVHYRAQAGVVKVASEQEQVERAQIIAELYISQASVSAPASVRLGKAFQSEGLGEYALSCYYQATGLKPKSPEPYKLLGYYYLGENDQVRAEENFRRSFELDPYQSDVSGELGRMGVIVGLPRKTDTVNAPESQ
ncbi:MAG: tetratricopeptide repeat protein [Planctomycetota bacterium]